MKLFLILITAVMMNTTSVTNIPLKSLSGEELSLSKFKGKKILIVNTASRCGYTGQYADLQKLYNKYKLKLEIIGMPCNQFMMQEPGSDEKIAAFCKKNYGVTFTMLSKGDVKGSGQHPLYKWLTSKSQNGVFDAKVSWNFNKFLLDENGVLLKHFESNINPMSNEIVDLIK